MVGVAYRGSWFLKQFRWLRGGGFREPCIKCMFLMFFWSLPWGGSAECFNNLLKHLLFFNCFAIVVLQLCFANVCCNCVLQVWEVLTVVKAQEVLTVVKVQEVLTVVKAQEVLTDVKSNKS